MINKGFIFSFMIVCFACGGFAQLPSGFKQDSTGVLYRVEKSNPQGDKVVEGDVVSGRYSLQYGDSLVFDGFKMPSAPMFGAMAANRAFKGDMIDGLFLMREGEIYTFAFPYDSIAKIQKVPPFFKKGDYAFYKVEVERRQPLAEYQKEMEAAYKERMRINDSLQLTESERVMKYLADNNISNIPFDEIYYKQIREGHGSNPDSLDVVKVNYTGKFLDGKVFDSSEGREPLEFTIGKRQMIVGFERGVKLMKEGEKAIIVIPSSLAYGSRQRGQIPPYSTLVFELELLEIKDNAK